MLSAMKMMEMLSELSKLRWTIFVLRCEQSQVSQQRNVQIERALYNDNSLKLTPAPLSPMNLTDNISCDSS